VSTIKSALPGDIPAPGPSRINGPPLHDLINDNDVKDDIQYDVVPADDVDEEDTDYELKEGEAELRGVRFAHLAEIKFHDIRSSVIRYHGEEYETSKFFTKKEMGWYGRYAPFRSLRASM